MSAEPHPSSADPVQVERFSRIAAEWWDPRGKFAPLHKFNPVRLAFIREQACRRFGRDEKSLQPFEGLSLLDIGCGGGLLSEPMRRLGFRVTGVDASERNVAVARAHAEEHQQAGTDRGDDRPVDRDRGRRDPLNHRLHSLPSPHRCR